MTVQTATETVPFPRATGRQKGYRAVLRAMESARARLGR